MSTTLSSTVPHIYQLPDEILSTICLLAVGPNLLCKSLQVGGKRADISFDAQKYRSKLAEELKVARVLQLVSRRFNYLARPLLFEKIVLIQYRTNFWGAPWLPGNCSISMAKVPELAGMKAIMKKLHDLFWLNPELKHHCKSLCVVYRELPLNIMYYSDSGDEENILSGIGNEDEDGRGSEDEVAQQGSGLVPCPVLLNDFFSWLANVTDLHIHIDHHTGKIPDFSQALRSTPNLTTLRITGQIDYLPIIDQIITLDPGAALQTLDMSDAMAGSWDYHEIDRQKVIHRLQDHAGTAPFTRLLAGSILDAEVLTALVAWPKNLERFAHHVDSQRISSHSAHGGSLQPALDTQKHSLTHLRIEGDYELGLYGFDLRDFPRLEHLSLCNATMSNFNQYPRNKTVVPELDARIFAPRLRSLLWRSPWWLTNNDKVRDFFSKKHEKRLRSLLAMALKLREERGDKEWQFERVWVQGVLEVPDSSKEKTRRNFEKDMDRLRTLRDEFRPLGIEIQRVPVPEVESDSERVELSIFEPRDQVWSWDENSK